MPKQRIYSINLRISKKNTTFVKNSFAVFYAMLVNTLCVAYSIAYGWLRYINYALSNSFL